jgi:hypothetical protein
MENVTSLILGASGEIQMISFIVNYVSAYSALRPVQR